MSLIGIDVGTSFIKGAILNTQTCHYEHVIRIPFPEPLALDDIFRCEFEVTEILKTVNSMIHELADATLSCEGIVMCTQMASMVLTDETGNALSNCIGWRDQRAAMPYRSGGGSYHDAIRHRLAAYRLELGNELPVGAPACFLFWLNEHGQLGANSIPLTLADFILGNLCRSRPTVDATNALAYGLLHIDVRQWHQRAIQQLGLSNVQLPAIVEDGYVIGYMRLGKRHVPCFAPMGDYQSALVGTMVTTKELSLNISTGSQVSRITDTLQKGDYQSRPFFENKFANTLSHLPAGRALNVLVDLLTEIERKTKGFASDPWEYITQAASSADKTDLEVKTTFFPGPCGNKGSITNIGERNLSVGTMFRAAFSDMVKNYHDCAMRIWPDRSWENLCRVRRARTKNAIASPDDPRLF